MKFSKFILVLVIASVAVLSLVLGLTYAFYTSNDGVNTNVTTSNEDPRLVVTFNQSQYINFNVGIPIPDNMVDTQASKSIFTINPDGTKLANKDVAITVSLVNLSIDNELKISDFKYDLICNDGTDDIELSTGTGESFTSEVLSNSLLPLGSLSTSTNTFDATKDYTCTFRLWLHETGNEQNSLMGKNFSGVLKVSSAYK